ncbi:MAG: tetratricopeptide repeat protein [Armatimonadota bacterium]
MAALPAGTVTFLFTDIEGSTRLWEEYPEEMTGALARHDALLREAAETRGGFIFKTVGDAFCIAFDTGREALDAALAAQQSLQREPWETPNPLRVRMALHAGTAELRDRDYFGPPLNRVARLLDAGHGGQTLLSDIMRSLTQENLPVGVDLLDLGEHYLRDLGRPEWVFELRHPDLAANFPPLRSLRSPSLPNNLPSLRTSFIGRKKEVSETISLLQTTRLLTLTGSGGCGKTRLSLQIAADVLDSYRDGVWLVELASLSDGSLVPYAVANVFELKEILGEPITATLTGALQGRQALLLLDNCEHVLDSTAHLADTLLRSCPKLKILASSREGLGIPGEQTYRIPSLSLPDPGQAQTPDTVLRYESVRLFTERALLARPDFAVTQANASVLAQLCQRLDGIPFAIELAAARTKSLSVEEISQRLDQRFRLLTGGSRTALPRQQTLRSLIDWSYNLLTAEEKTLLLRLSVFQGGWTLAAAESVCTEGQIQEWDVLDLLTDLVDKSLALADEAQGQTRYCLLETVRQYARDRSLETDVEAAEAARDRHLACYLALAEQTDLHLHGPDLLACLRLLDTESDNMRTALRYAIDAGRTEAALRLSGALREFWWLRGLLQEGQNWYPEALAMSGDEGAALTAARARALFGSGYMALMQSDFARSNDAFTEAFALYRLSNDREGMAHVLLRKGYLYVEQRSYDAARDCFRQSLTLYRERNSRYGIARVLYGLAAVAMREDFAAAHDLFKEGLAICREAGDMIGISGGVSNLATLAAKRGDFSEASAFAMEGITAARESGNRYFLAGSLSLLGWSTFSLGEPEKACLSFQESIRIYQDLGNRMPLIHCLSYFAFLVAATDSVMASRFSGAAYTLCAQFGFPSPATYLQTEYAIMMRENKGDAACETAFAEGSRWTLEQAVTAALEWAPAPRDL